MSSSETQGFGDNGSDHLACKLGSHAYCLENPYPDLVVICTVFLMIWYVHFPPWWYMEEMLMWLTWKQIVALDSRIKKWIQHEQGMLPKKNTWFIKSDLGATYCATQRPAQRKCRNELCEGFETATSTVRNSVPTGRRTCVARVRNPEIHAFVWIATTIGTRCVAWWHMSSATDEEQRYRFIQNWRAVILTAAGHLSSKPRWYR